MYTPCSVACRVLATGVQLHVLLAVECVGLLEVMSLMLVVIAYLESIGIILEEETPVTLVVIEL